MNLIRNPPVAEYNPNGVRVWSAPEVRRIQGFSPEHEASRLFADPGIHVIALSSCIPIVDPSTLSFVITAVVQERVNPQGAPDDEESGVEA